MFPPEHDEFSPLAIKAFEQWAPGARVNYWPLRGGHSGAVVLKVEVRNARDANLESGHYILKLSRYSKWSDQDTEIQAHARARNWDQEFAQTHIPALIEKFEYRADPSDSGYAMLYDIAGSSLDAFGSSEGPENDGFFLVSDRVTTDLLRHWVAREPHDDKRPDELLEMWLGYRLDPAQAGPLHSFVSSVMGRDNLIFYEAGELLLNPIKFYEHAKERQWLARGILPAMLHQDLYPGNILLHRVDPEGQPYWIIDFGLSVEGPAGFDQAYMEVAQVINSLGGRNAAYLVGVLKQLETPNERRVSPSGTFWLKNCLQKMRQAVLSWRDTTHTRRIDDINRQFTLARVAAGINWANKPTLAESQRVLALCYAGWAAREYVRNFEPSDWDTIASSTAQKAYSLPEAVITPDQPADEALWEQLWKAVGGFSPRAGRYILVAEAQDNISGLRAIGQLPWSAVIDLDPYSDATGLHRHAAPILQSHRGLHTFNNIMPVMDFGHGTAWMMSAGWDMKREAPTDYREWIYQKIPSMRSLVKSLDDAVTPAPIYVVAMPGGSLDRTNPFARLSRVIKEIDETLHGRVTIVLLGRRDLLEQVSSCRHIPLDVDPFITYLERTFGLRARTDVAQIPGREGEWHEIPIDSLRTMQENLIILHSNILEEVVADENAQRPNNFWRGRPPSWVDYQNGSDIDRPIVEELYTALKEELGENRNRTVVLHHNPGAGGSTAALRVAWDLHWEYPTAILTRWSLAVPDRLQNLYNLAQKPVLLVAEASDLTEAAREDLHRALAQRRARVVVLYVRRVFQAVADQKREEQDDKLSAEELEGSPAKHRPPTLYDPMSRQESEDFCKAYMELTDDERRRKELVRITTDPEMIRYRSPFFYGLITYERDFESIDRYVSSHILGMWGRTREMMEYLALITIYSNTGIHEVLLRQMMGLSGDVAFSLSELLGAGPARLLTIRQGRVRMMHQVIAEEVLRDTVSAGKDTWKLGLSDLATDFIRAVTACVNPDSQVVLDMFRQLFIDRIGSDVDDDERQDFSPLIEDIDAQEVSLGQQVLEELTKRCQKGAHFWNHLGRHQVYRLGRDENKAEEHLQRAIMLSPDDYIHHHTLGVVRRSRVRKMLSSLSNQTASHSLEIIAPHFEGAVDAFERTRTLNPENMHGYITHVQMILEVADHLKRASGVENIGQIGNDEPVIAWLEEHIATAERLLDDAQQLYGTLDQEDTYITSCYTKLERLYGNLDEVVRLWELANVKGANNSISRRALAHAYLARNNRQWNTLQLSELRRIVELTELNLRSAGRRDEDYRLWFDAYKLFPGFEFDKAVGKLRLWSSHFPSWRAYYYLYILYFYLWFSGRTEALDEMEEYAGRCKKFFFGRRSFTHLWLGYGPEPCPLVPNSDLGEWNRKKTFWKNADALRPVNGFIDIIDGPQAGNILIDGKVKVFFVPQRKLKAPQDNFYPNKDENIPVHFLLGFTPEGLRAWEVTRGHVENGNRIAHGQRQPALAPVHVVTPALPERVKMERARSLHISRVMEFVDELIRVRSLRGAELTLEELEGRLESTFGVDNLIEQMGFSSLEKLLDSEIYKVTSYGEHKLVTLTHLNQEETPRLRQVPQTILGQIKWYDPKRQFGKIEGQGERWFKKEYVFPAERGKLKEKGQIVEFTPGTNERGLIATGIRILPDSTTLTREGLIPQDALGRAVEAAVLQRLNDALISDEGITLRDMSRILASEFEGATPLSERLGVKGIGIFLRRIDGVQLFGEYPDILVSLKDRRSFGRLLWRKDKSTAFPLAQRVKVKTVEVVREAETRMSGVSVPYIEKRLAREFPGPEKLTQRLGYMTLMAFLSDIPELEVYGDNPAEQYVRSKQRDGRVRIPGRSGADTQPATDPKSVTIKIVTEACAQGQDPMLVLLATRLWEALPGQGKLVDRLGGKPFKKFITEIDELEMYGSAEQARVRLRRPVSAAQSGHRAIPHTARMADSDIVASAKATIVRLVKEAETDGQSLKVSVLSHKLQSEILGQGKLAHRLGYPSMLELLRNIPEMEVYGDDPTDQLVRMSRSQPSRVDMHPAVDSANSTLPPVETVRERAVEIVQRAQSAGEKILAHVVAKELGKAFNDNKTLISQLGYESSLQFLTETPGLEVYTEDANKRYVRLRNTEEPLKQDMLNVSSG